MYRIDSINNQDATPLYKPPYELEALLKLCLADLNQYGIGTNPYDNVWSTFSGWNFNKRSKDFSYVLTCLVTEILYQILVDINK